MAVPSVLLRSASGVRDQGAGDGLRVVVGVVARLPVGAQAPVVKCQSRRVMHVLWRDNVNGVRIGAADSGVPAALLPGLGATRQGPCDGFRGAGTAGVGAGLTGRSAIAPGRCPAALTCTWKRKALHSAIAGDFQAGTGGCQGRGRCLSEQKSLINMSALLHWLYSPGCTVGGRESVCRGHWSGAYLWLTQDGRDKRALPEMDFGSFPPGASRRQWAVQQSGLDASLRMRVVSKLNRC